MTSNDPADAPGTTVRVERVYDVLDREPVPGELWVLIDRLWPRGVAKARLAGALWDRDIAPSTELRRAYHGGEVPEATFDERYRAELAQGSALGALRDRIRVDGAHTVVLLVASKEPQHSQAVVLSDLLSGTE